MEIINVEILNTYTCDVCKNRLILILHLNYDVQPIRDFRICKDCWLKLSAFIVWDIDFEDS